MIPATPAHAAGQQRWRASPFPPFPPLVFVLCCTMHFLVIFNYSKAGRSPAGLSLQSWLAKPGPASWLWYTGHTVGDQRHPGACLAGGLSQRSWIAKPGPASWLWYTGHPIVVSGTSWCHHCQGVWVQGFRLVGYSCPLPPFAANQSTNELHASIAFGCIQLGIIRLIINMSCTYKVVQQTCMHHEVAIHTFLTYTVM